MTGRIISKHLLGFLLLLPFVECEHGKDTSSIETSKVNERNSTKINRGGPTIDNCDCGLFKPWCCLDDLVSGVDNGLDFIFGGSCKQDGCPVGQICIDNFGQGQDECVDEDPTSSDYSEYDSGSGDYSEYDSGSSDYSEYDSGSGDYSEYDSDSGDYSEYDSDSGDYSEYDSGSGDYSENDSSSGDYSEYDGIISYGESVTIENFGIQPQSQPAVAEAFNQSQVTESESSSSLPSAQFTKEMYSFTLGVIAVCMLACPLW